MNKRLSFIIFIFLFFLALLGVRVSLSSSGDITIQPNPIYVGAFFNGTSVKITGNVPEECDVIVKITSSKDRLVFRKKGRIGILWMNVGEIHFDQVYSLYHLYSSAPFSKMGLTKWSLLKELELGYQVLEKNALISPSGLDNSQIFKDFLKLKKKEGLYTIQIGKVKFLDLKKTFKSFELNFWLPPNVHIGDYQVEIFGIKRGNVLTNIKKNLSIQKTGLVASIYSLAMDHGVLSVSYTHLTLPTN